MLPAFPLCLAWLDYPVLKEDKNAKSNLVAVGTFEPYIEVWDLGIPSHFPSSSIKKKTNLTINLDVVDSPAPLSVLGGPQNLDDLGTKKKLKLTPGTFGFLMGL